mmetsp:Transcript_42698/g.101362  ORF Transcript_42698/g.101362 Transcript_42698/m.101362 type:complete len:226 (+) Transcript_42698:1976-2653(+)
MGLRASLLPRVRRLVRVLRSGVPGSTRSASASCPPDMVAASVSSIPENRTMMIVMSSVRVSYCSQRLYASAVTASAASCGSPCWSIMSTTLWLLMNSQTPSLAMTRNSTLGSTRLMDTSGSAMTPMRSAALSPTLRVKAVPGYIPLCAQSLGGSPLSSSSVPQHSTLGSLRPSSWSRVSTLAPACLTRAHSSRLKGVWSMERSTATSCAPWRSAMTARESPTFAV